MASNVFNTPVLLHGIGSGVMKTVSGKVLSLSTAQSMKVNVTTSSEDVYGGDSLFPIYTYLTQKEGTIEITNADFKLSQLGIAQGVVNSEKNNKRNYRVLVTKDSTKLTDDSVPVTGVEVTALIAPDGTTQPFVTDAATDEVIYISNTGEFTVGANVTMQEGEYEVWFKADEAEAVSSAMQKNAMCETGSFDWMFVTEDSEGNRYQVDIHADRVRASGEFALETARDSASTPTLNLKILDPGNGKTDFATITMTKLKD